MILGSMKEVFLARAKDLFLFDCRVAGMDAQALNAYHNVLGSFIRFTGNIQVKQLTPDYVNMYIANLWDGPSEGDEHDSLVTSHYAVIQVWIRWMFSQKFLIERTSAFDEPPHWSDLFPMQLTRRLPYCC